LHAHSTVVYCAIDDLIPVTGKPLLGFPEFLDGLAEAGIPCVWVTGRNRHQLDQPMRRMGHAAPFIAEGGSGAFLPEDYFHLKPERTVRLGRFTTIPVATPQPAAAEALDALSEETGVAVVPLRSLSQRELVQNIGLSKDAAEALRQRDFDEIFFFAGASDEDVRRFQMQAAQRKVLVRQAGAFWSLAVGASLSACVRHLRKLYDRALHSHAFSIAVAPFADAAELVPACDRGIVLTDRSSSTVFPVPSGAPAPKCLPLFGPDTWEMVLEAVRTRQF